MADHSRDLVLVTGGSGFLGAHCILACLNANYHVRTTVRSLKRQKEVRDMVLSGGAASTDNLSFVVADLTKDHGWDEAVKGCTYVLHAASPFPPAPPKNENDIIVPAREGTLRVLRAAKAADVKRVVVTSSFAAVGYGHRNWDYSKHFTEAVWTDPDGPNVHAYLKSKTIAERAAWDFIEKEGGDLELSVVNPVAIFGPVLGSGESTSIELITRLMNGSLPACPNMCLPLVDVRDVADLHLLAMTDPKAKGERFLCVSPPGLTVKEMSLALREKLGKAARRCPTGNLPDFLVKIMAFFDPAVALVVPELGKVKLVSADKAMNLLGWKPRSNIEACVAAAESLIKFGLVKP